MWVKYRTEISILVGVAANKLSSGCKAGPRLRKIENQKYWQTDAATENIEDLITVGK